MQKKIAVVGAGLIGRRHIEILADEGFGATLSAIVDPTEGARAYAAQLNVPYFVGIDELLAADKPDGVVIATPNQLHVQHGLQCIGAGCPTLIEKPIAVTSGEAQELVALANHKHVPILVGHHRRHNPLIQTAKSIIDSGSIGNIVAVHGTCWFLKPDDYFVPEWRRRKGAGPVMINSIHDIDLMRFLCGEVVEVRAISSNKCRKLDVEDTAAVLFTFESGALGTFSLSDTIGSPWSWELTSGENSEFVATYQSCYMIGGTLGSLSIPDLRVWTHGVGGHWKQAVIVDVHESPTIEPLQSQLEHFLNVIAGTAVPLVSGEEGLKSLRVVEAIQRAVELDEAVRPGDAAGLSVA